MSLQGNTTWKLSALQLAPGKPKAVLKVTKGQCTYPGSGLLLTPWSLLLSPHCLALPDPSTQCSFWNIPKQVSYHPRQRVPRSNSSGLGPQPSELEPKVPRINAGFVVFQGLSLMTNDGCINTFGLGSNFSPKKVNRGLVPLLPPTKHISALASQSTEALG